MAKPSTLPRWAETAGGTPATNIVAPNSGKQDTGYTTGGDVPPSGVLNWLFTTIFQWIKYLDGLLDNLVTMTKGLVVTTTTAGGYGIAAVGKGAGVGVSATGGDASGYGVAAAGGNTDGGGILAEGFGMGHGVKAHAYGAGAALRGENTGTGAALHLVPQSAPTAPADGDIWVETGTNTIKVRINGATKTITIT